MYCRCLILYPNREEEEEKKKSKELVPLQIVEFWVLLRTSGLENSVWDDYQKCIESKGAGLLLLSFSPSERAI